MPVQVAQQRSLVGQDLGDEPMVEWGLVHACTIADCLPMWRAHNGIGGNRPCFV